jgi:hypothetical protein
MLFSYTDAVVIGTIIKTQPMYEKMDYGAEIYSTLSTLAVEDVLCLSQERNGKTNGKS